jgi:hypothetical protein
VLFEQYVDELSKAKKATTAWWRRLISAESAQGLSPQQAEERVRERWPMGPTGHPRVLATYRKFFIACEQLNNAVSAEYKKKLQEEDAQEIGGWGVEDPDRAQSAESSDDWGEESIIDPPRFLVEMLVGRRDDLAEFMMFLVFSPIGGDGNRSL